MSDLKTYKDKFDDLILRDYLAVDRTKLANERTFLAYVRTFISLLVSGVGFIKLVDGKFFIITGYILSIISPFVLIHGLDRFIKVNKRLEFEIEKQSHEQQL